MDDEFTVCAATYFRLIGKDVSTAEEFVMSTSLELKWMAPSDSKLLLKALLAKGIIVQKGDFIRPGSDFSAIDLPLTFKPSKLLLEEIRSGKITMTEPRKEQPKKEVPPDMFHILIDIAKKNGLDKGFVPACSKLQKKIDVDICVAALLILRDNGVDVSEQYPSVYGSLVAKK